MPKNNSKSPRGVKTNVTSLDDGIIANSTVINRVKRNPQMSFLIAVIIVAIAVLSVYGVQSLMSAKNSEQVASDVVPKRDGIEGSQNILHNARIVKSAGKGTITTIDNQQGGKEVSADLVGIDASGSNKGATLAPPENISQVGWYVRSAPAGSKGNDGTTVMTSHVNYNGVTGYGSVFHSLKKGDPITVTRSDGKTFHYTVIKDPYQLDKKDKKYVAKTMDTINRSKGKNALILITCGGKYVGGALGYEQNYVIEANLS